MSNLFGRQRASERVHAVPDGARVYAIGDVHGRLDLLERLLAEIERDGAQRGFANTKLIFLGDLVDRGPDSAGVVARVRSLCELGVARLLQGNHEEMFILAAQGDRAAVRGLMGVGGTATLFSYGLDRVAIDQGSYDDLAELIHNAIPSDDIAFLRSGQNVIVEGDYAFVHAGIRPGVPLDEQRPTDLRWIRQTFLNSAVDHGHMIVHGHTVTAMPDERPNRIGIDTGAYRSGVLTALGLEGKSRWFLSASDTSPLVER